MSENENKAPSSSGDEDGRVATERTPSAAVSDGSTAEQAAATPAAGGEAVPSAAESASPAADGASAAETAPAAPDAATPGSSGAANGAASAASANGSASPTPMPRSRDEAGEEAGETAPGSVPTPPPWRRVPGEEVPARAGSRPGERPTVADALLSEAPTAYIDRGASGASAAAESGLPRVEVPRTGRIPRQALLQVKRFDPWSVLKLALVLAGVVFLIWLVAVGVLYGVLDGMGVWDRLNGTYADLVSGESPSGGSLISAGRVFGIAAIVGAINSLLFAVAITVGAFVYNVSSDLVGGIEVTLSERD